MKIDINKIPIQIRELIYELNNFGYGAYLCGGAVRDLVMRRIPQDYDICTSAMPQEMIFIFKKYKVIKTGIKHGTITVINNGIFAEITTFREDKGYIDGRHPESVKFIKSLKEDMARRDFTINALAMDCEGEIIDYFSGLKDIENKIIRCIGSPIVRFSEDYLRLIRCIRFSAQLNFIIELHTFEVLCELSNNIRHIAIERTREEFNKIITSCNVKKGMNFLIDSGIMKYIIPEIYACIGFNQNNIHHDKNVYEHIIAVVENIKNRLPLRLAALLHDIGKPTSYSENENGNGHFYNHQNTGADIAKNILNRLKYDNLTIGKIHILIKNHMARINHLRKTNIKKFINQVGEDNLNDLFDLMIADVKGARQPFIFTEIENLKNETEKILNMKEPLKISDLKIGGYDLIKIGHKPSKQMGDILNYLLEKVLENPKLNTKNKLLEMAKQYGENS